MKKKDKEDGSDEEDETHKCTFECYLDLNDYSADAEKYKFKVKTLSVKENALEYCKFCRTMDELFEAMGIEGDQDRMGFTNNKQCSLLL